MRKFIVLVGVIVATATMTSTASAAFCSDDGYSVLRAGANTSCALATNAANHAITYYNRMGDWPSRVSGYSSVTRKWYRFSLVGYYPDSVKYRGRSRDGSVAFSMRFWD